MCGRGGGGGLRKRKIRRISRQVGMKGTGMGTGMTGLVRVKGGLMCGGVKDVGGGRV